METVQSPFDRLASAWNRAGVFSFSRRASSHPPDLLQVRTPGVCFHVLKDADGLCLIDSGFVGGVPALRRALRRRGWSDLPIRWLLLTHGHLDHVRNVAAIVRASDCRVAAPRDDLSHYQARHVYHGLSRVCGLLERAGRACFGYEPFQVDRLLDDGDELPPWGGLRTVHLPGHTAGHSGFFSAGRGLLFCGDLFATHHGFSHTPPDILNSHPEMIPASIDKALALPLEGVAPNHCDRSPFAVQLERLRKLRTS